MNLKWIIELNAKSLSIKLLPSLVFLPRKFQGQGRLAVYSPWGCKESSMSELLSTGQNKTIKHKAEEKHQNVGFYHNFL